MLINKSYTRKFLDEQNEDGGEADQGGKNEFTPEQFNALQTERDSMKAKMDQLLTETKQAKASARAAAEEKSLLAEEKAKKDGDFEQLHKSSEQKRNELQSELEQLRGNIANEKRNNTAMKLASELADGANAEILSEFVSRRIKYTDDGIKVLDDNGQLTVSSLDDLKADFANNQRYASLLKGNQSSGGGATGGKNSGGATDKVLTRAEFDKLSPIKRMDFVKSSGNVID